MLVREAAAGWTGPPGAAYVFRHDGSTWLPEQILSASDSHPNDFFGESIAAFGSTIVVGAPGHNEASGNEGAAYVFRFNGTSWDQEQKLLASDGESNDHLGVSVAIGASHVIVGADSDDQPLPNSGSARVFAHQAGVWVEQQTLAPPGLDANDEFGVSVALSGNVAVVGAQNEEDNGDDAGAAYVFRFDGTAWIIQQKLVASDGGPSDRFGRSVTVDGDLVLVGAPLQNIDGCPQGHGAAYLYEFVETAWVETRTLRAAGGTACAGVFGTVAMSGDLAVIGDSSDDTLGQMTGAAYVYDFQGTDCNDNAVCDPRELALGLSFDCTDNGRPDDCDIADDPGLDGNGNGIPDTCEDAGDLNGDGQVGTADLLQLLATWGPCKDCDDCPDFDGNCVVGTSDLLFLLDHWGQ